MRRKTSTALLPGVVLITGFFFSSCTDTEFRDRPLFDPIPDEAAGFVGYSDVSAKLTVCGNCHVEKQLDWEQTAHAHAWETLQSSGSARDFCEGCHTVNQRGNFTDVAGGYLTVADERYEDVQCEACHGPGETHVTVPDASQPLASLAVGVGLTSGCGECHSGAHHPFVEEWSLSDHAKLSESRADNTSCAPCHSGDGALRAWGVDTRYVEEELGTHVPITCAVCHDPHGSPNTAQLRFPINVASVEQNLCMRCHQRRPEPDFEAASRGPHSPQGPLLLGAAGWWPPEFEVPPLLIATHGSEGNPGLCTTCHVASLEVRDAETDEFLVHSTGHLFQPIPCLDDDGIPTPEKECDDGERSFAACAGSGCHGSEAVARGLKFQRELSIADRIEEVNDLLDQVPAGEFDNNDGRFTVAEGALFNRKLAEDRGSAVHNPFLVEALLVASIKALENTYGLAPPSGASSAPRGGSGN